MVEEERNIFTGEELLNEWLRHEILGECHCRFFEERKKEVIECDTCGYKGTGFLPVSCFCYDEICNAKVPSSGCTNEYMVCPICEHGDYDVIGSLKSLRNYLRTKKYMEVPNSSQS